MEDVKVVAESRAKSSIFVVDSCANEVKEFGYRRDERITLSHTYGIENGMPISVVANQMGILFVLTDLPRRIYIIDQRGECNNNVQK